MLDDLESQPGSATALLRTVIGVYLRDLGGWIAVAHLIRLAEALGVPAPRARTALVRVKQAGLIVGEPHDRVAGYRLAPQAVPTLLRGDRRIYHPRTMSANDRWCLISFSIPEEMRALRHQLRRRLAWIGCGTVASALWITPAFLLDEVEGILDELELRDHATVFVTDAPRVSVPLSSAVAEWWDLEAIRALHEDFLAATLPLERATDLNDEQCFEAYMTLIDAWRPIPYFDPGLPYELLPIDWPGRRTAELFADLRNRFSPGSDRFVQSVVASGELVGDGTEPVPVLMETQP